MGWSERRLLAWIRARSPVGERAAPGHDAAVLPRHSGRSVLCVDHTIEGVHVLADVSPRKLGRKAVARALSDLAATAATPEAVLLALSAPADRPESRLRAILGGAWDMASEHGAAVVGGDLAAAPGPLRLSVSAFGRLGGRRRPPGRDRARPGDLILCTGACGGSVLGRHLRLIPRLAEGRHLWEAGCRALQDVSDGLALDLERLARASGVRIDLERVPIHSDAKRAARRSGRSALDHALHDGEDHELIASLPASIWGRAGASLARRFPGLEAIGRVRSGRGLFVPREPSESNHTAEKDSALVRWHPGRGGFVHGE